MKKTTKKSFLLLIIVIFFWYAQYVYIPYQNPYLASINISVNVIGMVIGGYGISQLLLRLPVGMLADLKKQHKFFIILGSALAGGASCLRVLCPNAIGFFIGNIISGFASATWISFIVLFVSFYPKPQASVATCKIIMANNLGIFLAFLSSTLLFKHYGMIFICILSIISGLIALILATQLRYPQRVTPALPPKMLLGIFCHYRLVFFAFLALIQQGIQMSTTMSFTNQIIVGVSDNSSAIGIASMIYMLSAVFFAQFGTSYWRQRLPLAFWIVISFILLAMYCFLIPNAPTIYIIYLLQIIPGIATGILFSFLTSEAMKGVPNNMNSTAMGLFQAIYAIGMTLFPIIVGYLSKVYSLKLAYNILGVIALVGASLYILFIHIFMKYH